MDDKRAVYIFKLNALFRPEDVRSIRTELQRQIEEGVLLLDHCASFVGREIDICGHDVTVEFVGENGVDDHLRREADKNPDGSCVGYQQQKKNNV